MTHKVVLLDGHDPNESNATEAPPATNSDYAELRPRAVVRALVP